MSGEPSLLPSHWEHRRLDPNRLQVIHFRWKNISITERNAEGTWPALGQTTFTINYKRKHRPANKQAKSCISQYTSILGFQNGSSRHQQELALAESRTAKRHLSAPLEKTTVPHDYGMRSMRGAARAVCNLSLRIPLSYSILGTRALSRPTHHSPRLRQNYRHERKGVRQAELTCATRIGMVTRCSIGYRSTKGV